VPPGRVCSTFKSKKTTKEKKKNGNGRNGKWKKNTEKIKERTDKWL
jgi:hypothetical protein